MARKLGICAATGQNLNHIIGLTLAAEKAGLEVQIFLTGDGVHLTKNPRFQELLGHAKVKVCEVSYIAKGYKGQEVPGLVDKDFVTQAWHAEMVEECDKYLII